MKYYFAPMEGITGAVYRRVHRELFPYMDGYFSPFISPTQNHCFSPRELRDVLPEQNEGVPLIPQLLTHNADDFVWAAEELTAMGYGEVNLNLGCPSGTVTAKKKGSGFLAYPEELDSFFAQIFDRLPRETAVSVKTRLGVNSSDEFYEILAIFNKYPLKEVIIHPRIRSDFYKNTPNLEVFRDAVSESRNEVWYNGDLFQADDLNVFHSSFPEVSHVMLGRGLVTNPGLAGEMMGLGKVNKKMLEEFHQTLYEGYLKTMSGERNVLFRMKELWSYFLLMFEDTGKAGRRIRKAKNRSEYETAVSALFRETELSGEGGYRILL